jgi:G:T-mismatch repair DNA endonuclease (very short patch repair protein)
VIVVWECELGSRRKLVEVAQRVAGDIRGGKKSGSTLDLGA